MVIPISPTPWGENCALVGRPGYSAERAKAECRAYIGQLRRYALAAGKSLNGLSIAVSPVNHGYGTFYEVTIDFDDADTAQADTAYYLCGMAPKSWDAQARADLGLPA